MPSKKEHKKDDKKAAKADTPKKAAPAAAVAESSKAEDKAESVAASHHEESAVDDSAAAASGGVPLHLLKKMINQVTYADVHIVTSAKSGLYAHKFILDQRCPKLAGLVKKDKKGGKVDIAPLFISHESMEQVIHFIYTDDFDFKGIKDAAVIDLNGAATKLGLSRLKWLASNHLQQTLSLTNVFTVMKKVKDDAQQDLVDIAIDFALKNYSAFVKDTTGVSVIGVETFGELVRVKESTGFTSPDLGPFPDQTLDADMRKIRANTKNTDLTLLVSDKKAIACHRAILGNHSKALATFVSDAKEKKELTVAMSGKVAHPPLSEEATNALLDWCYFGEQVSDPGAAAELVPWCHTHELPRLWEISEQTVLHNINDKTVMKVLDVAYLPCMTSEHKKVSHEMKTDGIHYTLNHLTSIDLTPLKKMNPAIPRDILVAEQERQQTQASAAPAKEEPKAAAKEAPKAAEKEEPKAAEAAEKGDKKSKKSKRSSSKKVTAEEPEAAEPAATEEVAAPAATEEAPAAEHAAAATDAAPAATEEKPAESSEHKAVESTEEKPAESSEAKPAEVAAETSAPSEDATPAEAEKSSKKSKKSKKSKRDL